MITKGQVIKAQNQWAHAVIEMGTIKEDNACKQCAINFIDEFSQLARDYIEVLVSDQFFFPWPFVGHDILCTTRFYRNIDFCIFK